jgi:hypothetical protein
MAEKKTESERENGLQKRMQEFQEFQKRMQEIPKESPKENSRKP